MNSTRTCNASGETHAICAQQRRNADQLCSDLDDTSLWEVRRLRLAIPEELGTADIPLTESSLREAFPQLSGAADQVKNAARGLQQAVKEEMRPAKMKKRKKPWASERYAVRIHIIENIIHQLGCGNPAFDAFADSGNHRFPR